MCHSTFLSPSATMNWVGLASIIVFYLAILGVGLWASRKTGKKKGEEDEESDIEADLLLAGRNIGLWVGICTMTGMRHQSKCKSI